MIAEFFSAGRKKWHILYFSYKKWQHVDFFFIWRFLTLEKALQ
jgi:hypothetical protein